MNHQTQEALLELFNLVESKTTDNNSPFSPEEEHQILELCRREPRLACEYLSHDQGLFLLNILIRFGVSLATLEAFFQFPISKSVLKNGDPLHQACGCENTQPGVIPFLIQQYPLEANTLGYNGRTGNLRAQAVKRRRRPIEWLLQRSSNVPLADVQALMSVEDVRLHYLADSKQERSLYLLVKGGAGLPVLDYLIGKVITLESFGITLDVQLSTRRAQLLSRLLTAAQMETFQLVLCCEVELQALLTLMMEGIGRAFHLQSLHLDFTRMGDVMPTGNPNNDEQISAAFHSALTAMPNLTGLTLLASKDKHPWANGVANGGILSETMATLLRRNRIQRLFIGKNITLDHEPIWEALKQNTSLQVLHMESCVDEVAKCESLVAILEDYNTSMEHVALIDRLLTPYDRKILYFVHLNVVGRSKARFSGNVQPEFLDLLLKADQLDALIHTGHMKPTPEQYLYGMLRESPGSWCQ